MAETAHSSTPIRLSPISSPSNSQRSLSEQINASSRSTHSQLNRSIIARLPMVLPPQTTEPSTYISGLLHIAPIYITFESLWASILETPYLPIMLGDSHASDACESESPLLAAQPAPTVLNTSNVLLNHLPKACSRTHALLAHLWLPGLLRSGRLRADIRSISGMSEHKFDEQVEEVSRSGKIAKFIAHTQQSVKANPHVLLAYAWVFYMALFSGGRLIRTSLQAAGPEFWTRLVHRDIDNNKLADPLSARPPYGSDPSLYGIQFLSFGGDEDGEDIKLEFKKRIAEAEILLTDEETWDIVQESVHIFNYMIDIVAELDAICGTTEYTGLEPQKSIQDGNIFQRKRLLVEPQKQQQG